jgi:hypothetical protein
MARLISAALAARIALVRQRELDTVAQQVRAGLDPQVLSQAVTSNVDGGAADTVFTPVPTIDGGGA